jgi:hypothetical protein
MKSVVLVFSLIVCLAGSSIAQDANRIEVGAFAEYFRIDRTNPDLNFAGLGGRIGFGLNRYTQIEGEISYDFDRTYTNVFSNGVTLDYASSQTHILNGLFGPKFQTGSGPFRFFATAKAGFINFSTNNQNAPSGFRSALGAVGNGNAQFAVYPGVGVEGFAGPFGLRLEVGDDIYFDNGARNNLRVTFGPTLRF